MKKVALISLLTSIFVIPQSLANEEQDTSGFYLGGHIGSISTEFGGSDLKNGTVFGVYGGYDFNHWLGVESNFLLSNNIGKNNVDVYAGVLSIAPKISYQINDSISIYSKVGIASLALELSDSTGSNTYSDLTWTYGFGVNVDITNNIAARLSYDVISGEVENENYFATGRNDIDVDMKLLMLGVQYHF